MGWTVGAAVILVFITVFTFIMLRSIKNPQPSLVDANGKPVAMANETWRSPRPTCRRPAGRR